MAWSASIDRLIYVKCTCKSAKVDSTAARQAGVGWAGLARLARNIFIHIYCHHQSTLHSFTQALFKHTLNIQLPIPSPRRGDEARDTTYQLSAQQPIKSYFNCCSCGLLPPAHTTLTINHLLAAAGPLSYPILSYRQLRGTSCLLCMLLFLNAPCTLSHHAKMCSILTVALNINQEKSLSPTIY